VKVLDVRLNNRSRAFELTLEGRGLLTLPYVRAEPPPTREDPVEDVFIDPELGCEGVTYRLVSGLEGSVLADQVLDYNADPGYLRDLLLHRLTVEAVERVENESIGIREISRRLGTSPTQLYRLLDTTNYRKTVDRMLELLQVLGAKVELRIT
jgi:hypothetical protein